MHKKKPVPDFDWDILDAAQQECGIADPPPGAITKGDYMSKYDVCEKTAVERLGRLVADGMLEKQLFSVKVGRGRTRRAFYWLAEKKEV